MFEAIDPGDLRAGRVMAGYWGRDRFLHRHRVRVPARGLAERWAFVARTDGREVRLVADAASWSLWIELGGW